MGGSRSGYHGGMWFWIIIALACICVLRHGKRNRRREPREHLKKAKGIYGFEENFNRLCEEAEAYAQRHALDDHQKSETILRKKHMAVVLQGRALLRVGGSIGKIAPPNGLVYWAKFHKREDLISEFRPLFAMIGTNMEECVKYWTSGDGGRLLLQYERAEQTRKEWSEREAHRAALKAEKKGGKDRKTPDRRKPLQDRPGEGGVPAPAP